MKHLIFILLFCLGLWGNSIASNVKIVEQPYFDPYLDVRNGIASIQMKITWDNSWRDDYNWDAVYIFLKCKRQTDAEWTHLYLMDKNHSVSSGYTYWMANSPENTVNKSTGIFVYRDKKGAGKSEVELTLPWLFSTNGYTAQELRNEDIIYEASVVEMVYVPKGPFVAGDYYSTKCFQRNYRQILPEWDLISPSTRVRGTDYNLEHPEDYNPTIDYSLKNICDRINDTRNPNSNYWSSLAHAWHSSATGAETIEFDFGSAKTVRYVAVEGVAANYANYKPTVWSIYGRKGTTGGWTRLGSFTGDDWITGSVSSYPTTKAVKLSKTGSYRYYQLRMETASTWKAIRNVSMTDKDLETLTEDAYVIDGRGNTLVFNETMGLTTKGEAQSGTLPEYAPVGYEGFYAMKYEISQAQYIGFLNKLILEQQKLRTIGDELETLEIGDYVYGSGDKKSPKCRNGIVVGAKEDTRYIFASNLNKADEYNKGSDGQNIACNYLSPADMMAYASWCGLRPLSELEYEKMCRQGWQTGTGKITFPKQGEYAWGSTTVKIPTGSSFTNGGMENEKLSNATLNTGGVVSGPVRVGAFAGSATAAAPQETSGGGFYGGMELSGNLAEIYYISTPAKSVLRDGLISHGNGLLNADGNMATRLNTYWGAVTTATLPSSFVVRGGSFASSEKQARVSDRLNINYFSNLNTKDSTVTFRLGHSMTYYQSTTYNPSIGDCYYPYSYLEAANGLSTFGKASVNDTVCTGNGYTIKGSALSFSQTYTGEPATSGAIYYVWYSKTEDPGTWRIIPGKNGKDLVLTANELQNNSSNAKITAFKRRTYTPDQYSETGYVNLYIVNADSYTRDEKEILKANNQVSGLLVETRSDATFSWYSLIGGKKKELAATYTGVGNGRTTSSYLAVHRDSFPSAVSGTLNCEVAVWGRCPSKQSFTFNVEARPTTGVDPTSVTLGNCGQFIKDPRDGEIYGTVQIGSQCWMSENLRYIKGGAIEPTSYHYSTLDPTGKIYGVLYCWGRYNTDTRICPDGWTIPSNNDFVILRDYMNFDNQAGSRLKAGNFWTIGNNDRTHYIDYIYAKPWKDGDSPTNVTSSDPIFNSSGFGWMGGGYVQYSNNGKYSEGTEGYFITRNGNYIGLSYGGTTLGSPAYAASSYFMSARCILTSTSQN